ncbi:DUF4340 domain-containing protein [Candidatus Uabimicrobium sp. HlEnr_7]|uniref:DUF4340 domain-containing protein n=1 Tax=Candidatus Uabimicrobium helgolandensis TaxID=3095367 RepID=UPI003555D828
MNKKLVILSAVAAVLAVGILIKNKMRTTTSVIEQTDAKKVLGDDFLIADIKQIALYDGSKAENKVEISHRDSKWFVSSSYNAPANEKKIMEFLNEFKKTFGELRSSNKDFHERYKVTDKTAFHLIIECKEGKQHFLIGKGLDQESCFLRNSENEKVYRVGGELRSKLDLAQDNNDLRKDTWIEKVILQLKKDKINKLSLTYPDKKFVLSKVEVKQEEKKDESKDKEGKEKKAKPKKKTYVWKLTSGGFGRDFKDEYRTGLLDTLSECKISDSVDPSKKAEYGLDKPRFRLEVNLNDKSKYAIVGSHPNPSGVGYCYLESKPNLVYELEEWRFRDIFKNGNDVFELPSLTLTKDDITQVDLTTADVKISFNKQEDKSWKANSEGEVDKDVIDDLLSAVSKIAPQDYTDATDKASLGLDASQNILTVTLKDNTKHSVYSGSKKSPVVDGIYIGVDENKPFTAISNDDHNKLFPKRILKEKVEDKPQESEKVEDKPQESEKVEDKPQENAKVEDKAQESEKVEDKPQESAKVEDKPQESEKVEVKTETQEKADESQK